MASPLPLRALAVDDNEDELGLLQHYMKRYGPTSDEVEWFYFEDPVDALKAPGPWDLVVTDWMMPTMSGLQFLRAFASHWSAARAIVWTCAADLDTVELALQTLPIKARALSKMPDGQHRNGNALDPLRALVDYAVFLMASKCSLGVSAGLSRITPEIVRSGKSLEGHVRELVGRVKGRGGHGGRGTG